MQRLYFISSIVTIALFFASCAPQILVPPAEVRSLDHSAPTELADNLITIPSPTAEVLPHNPPASCPVTTSSKPGFVPPAPYDSLGFEGEFWYGTSSLWTAVRRDGIWEALLHNGNGYTQKVFWWREGYVWTEEPAPNLIVTGERLDAAAPVLLASNATNAYADDIGSAMLVGVDIPTLGCWKITGEYGDADLSFVVWVAP